MADEISVLMLAAASIGFFHTLFGPDHSLPFIVMAQSGKWSLGKTSLITFICGLGHVLSSVILGFIGIVFGIAVSKLEIIEGFRGNLAAWALIAFGLVYIIWGLRHALRRKKHQHFHGHVDGVRHNHFHNHAQNHVHVHPAPNNKKLTPWILFTIFVFGPCEPLIPLLMYPAAKSSLTGLIAVTVIFSSITIGTMLAVVMISTWGIQFLPIQRLERHMHALSGATILLSGLAIQLLGL